MRRTLKALIKRESEFRACVGKMEQKIQGKCDFNCGIENVPGDGLCVINVETNSLAPIGACIEVIESEGKLTELRHKTICI